MPISVLPMRGNDDSWTVAPDGTPAHKSASIYLDSDAASPQKLTAQNGTVMLNGEIALAPAVAASVAVDDEATGIPAVVESQALFNILTYKFKPTAAEIAAGVDDEITNYGYDPYDLRRYGVDFTDADVATANTAKLNILGAAPWASDITLYWDSGKCRVNGALVFSDKNISHWFENRNSIEYYGAANLIAFTQGNASDSQGSKNALGGAGISIQNHTTNDYSVDDFVGLLILGTMQNSKGIIRFLDGFTTNCRLRPSTNGIAYNIFEIGILSSSKYNLDIHSYTNGTTEFVNENLFLGGSWRAGTLDDAIDSYGIHYKAESGAYAGHNRNVFEKPSFELGNAAGSTYRTPVFYNNAGLRNAIREARIETGRSAIVRIASDVFAVAGNRFDGAILGGTFTKNVDSANAGKAYDNSFTDLAVAQPHQQPQWHSGDLVKKTWPSASTQISIKGIVWGIQTNATLAYTQSGRVAKDYIIVADSARGLGVQIDTTYYKQFTIRKDVRASRGGRVTFVAFDSTGTILTDASGAHPYVVSNSVLTATSGANTWGGQKYATSSDGESPIHVTVGSDVATLRVFFTGGTAFLHIRSFSIYALATESNPKPLRVFTGLSQNDDTFYSTGVPGTNLGGHFVARGERIMNAAAASGQPSGWVCTAEGWLAKAWVLSTAYVIGDLVTNDTGKTYEMTATSGTSAGSGGPTGTGSGIIDGSCTWNYIGTQATFSAMANL